MLFFRHATHISGDRRGAARSYPAGAGTTGIKDTIDRALDEVVRADLRRRLAKRIQSGKGIDRGDEVLEASRRWQR